MSSRGQVALISVVAVLSLGVYLATSAAVLRVGFPLDDAWIHQVYARNLAWRGEWAFVPGQVSAGSTAPLWSVLLAAGYVLRLGPYVWTFALGGLMLAGLACLGYLMWETLCPERQHWAVSAGVFLALEWHLAWAAVSGMETLALAGLALLVMVWLGRGWQRWWLLGLVIAIALWIRPDGLTLFGPAALAIAIAAQGGWRGRWRAWAELAVGAALPLGLYLLFNRALAGAWWPNTFYAKQAEYALLREAPFWRRFVAEASLPLVGAGALLLPGMFLALGRAVQRRQWLPLVGLLWSLGYLGLYAWRLPVTYQHGRYVIPAMPVLFLWGLAGMAQTAPFAAPQMWRRVVGKGWLASVALTLLAFWLVGARVYARDVALIETEMVATAQWVNANLPQEGVIAAHDIGALGYFAFGDRSEQRLLDLAGLVSPEVVPFIRDEQRLQAYLDAHCAEYLVTFPDWYPYLASRGHLVYTSGGAISPLLGGTNMAVYRWNCQR